MNVFDALMKRKRAEGFLNEKIDERLIGVILHLATFSPSAGNLKPWEFIVVQDDLLKKKIFELALKEKKIIEAPVLIVVCIDMKRIGLRYGENEEYAIQDAASAITYMMIAAKGLGLDSDWIRNFDREKISSLLNLPKNLRVGGIFLLGKGKEFAYEPEISFENIAHSEKYGSRFS